MKRFLCFLLLAATCGSTLAADATRPNILFAIADDWGLHAGAYGTPWVKTPAFDRLAREGLLFQHAYTPMAKCAPSRAIVLTGRPLWQNEEAGNHLAVFPPKLKSWPEVLMEEGWHMGITGKGWGPGIANDANGQPRLITGKPFNQRKAEPPAQAMSNNDYAANFQDFLDAAPKGAPWCFWYGATEPHRAYEFMAVVNKGGKRLSDIDRVPAYWPDHETVRHDLLDYAGIAWQDSGMLPITGKSWRPILESTKAGRIVPERDHVLIGKERTDVGRPHNWGYPIRGIVTADHLYLRNYEPTRWPAGNPETGYLDTDGSPTKSLILELGRAKRADRYWQLNFGMRPADELYDLRADRDCAHNLASDPAHAGRVTALRQRMATMLKAQGDPRMDGRGHVFDNYRPTNGDGFYENFMRGEKVSAGWVSPADFEKQPIKP